MNTDKYTVGSQLESWNGSTAQSLTFIVTEDCNLRCKYCYITHNEYYGSNVPLFRRNGYRQSGTMIP